MEEIHRPVLLRAVLECLAPRTGESYLDLTAGYAGHARQILDATQNYKDAVLIDRDAHACRYLREVFRGETPTIVHADFYNATRQEIECGRRFDLILADLGVSSPQLDQGERGFSLVRPGPLDMRMDSDQALTAETIVNAWGERQLAEIFERYGEIKPGEARRVAGLIARGRPWRTTSELAEAIASHARRSRHHPATRFFQALRIAVNDELGLLEKTLALLPRALNPGGRVAVITFHSLEDRIVKRWLQRETAQGEESRLKLINKKPIVAEKEELFVNPRARSAKLRSALRTDQK